MTAGPGHHGHAPSPDELLARAGWSGVQTALLRGLAHDLSGRAAALGGLVELVRAGGEDLSMDGEGDLPAVDLLREESERLVEAVELIRLLAGDEDETPPEPLALEPLLSQVLRLHARHRGLEPVETVMDVEADVPPVRVRRDLLVKVLLTLLGAAGWAARNAGEGRIGVELRGQDDRAVVSLELPETGASAGGSAERDGPGPDLETARQGTEAALEADGAVVRRIGGEGAGGRLELSLPALRRRES